MLRAAARRCARASALATLTPPGSVPSIHRDEQRRPLAARQDVAGNQRPHHPDGAAHAGAVHAEPAGVRLAARLKAGIPVDRCRQGRRIRFLSVARRGWFDQR